MNRLIEKCAVFLLCLPGFLMAGSVAVAIICAATVILLIRRKRSAKKSQ